MVNHEDKRGTTALRDFARQNAVLLGVLAIVIMLAGGILGILSRAFVPPDDTATPESPTVTEPAVAEQIDDSLPTATPTAFPQEPEPVPSPTGIPEPTATPTPLPPFFEGPITYGTSFNGNPLLAYRLGYGPSARAIIGAIHGGYEWNTVNVVSDTLDYLRANPQLVPEQVTLYLIPCMNPDGYAAGRDAVVGRMNGNGVDLNRNWDYQHQITATHGTRPVKAGEYPFSEPETRFTRDFILERDIELVIFYHSAMGVIFSGAEPEKSATDELAEMLVGITGYTHNTEGIYGQITTGDSIDYLSAKEGIAGVEIELTTHALIGEAEWLRNLEGILAFLNWPIPGQAPPDLEDLDSGAWTYITYTVQTDDTLLGIVWNFKSDQDLIMALNGIENADQIWAGQVLTIPVRGGDE